MINDYFLKFINSLVSLLPSDPFISGINSFGSAFSPYISIINYFIPVGQMVDILTLWIVAVGTWYLWRALASWFHLVG